MIFLVLAFAGLVVGLGVLTFTCIIALILVALLHLVGILMIFLVLAFAGLVVLNCLLVTALALLGLVGVALRQLGVGVIDHHVCNDLVNLVHGGRLLEEARCRRIVVLNLGLLVGLGVLIFSCIIALILVALLHVALTHLVGILMIFLVRALAGLVALVVLSCLLVTALVLLALLGLVGVALRQLGVGVIDHHVCNDLVNLVHGGR